MGIHQVLVGCSVCTESLVYMLGLVRSALKIVA